MATPLIIVIGAGHNGLTASALLARRGWKVLLLEQRPELGGRCRKVEFEPGFFAPPLLAAASFRRWIAEELGLSGEDRTGLPQPRFLIGPENRTATLSVGDGPRLFAAKAGADSASTGLERLSRELERLSPALNRLNEQAAPSLNPGSARELWSWARRGYALQRLSEEDRALLLRVVAMPLSDWLGEHSLDPMVAEALAAEGLRAGFFGPRSPGTALQFLIEFAPAETIRYGATELIGRLEGVCRKSGVEIRTDCPVTRIVTERGRMRGVELSSGECVDAGVVLSAIAVKPAFLELLEPGKLTVGLRQQLGSYRSRGAVARVLLGIEGALELEHLPPEARELRLCTGSLNGLEQAFDAVKYRSVSTRPHLAVSRASLYDSGLCPPGHELLAVDCYCAPYVAGEEGNRKVRAEILDRIVDRTERLFGEFAGRIVASRVLTPADIEATYGLPGGNLYHGEHALDQLFSMRPAPELSGYRTPVGGLFVSGGGTHPGGQLTGLPGALAAREICRLS